MRWQIASRPSGFSRGRASQGNARGRRRKPLFPTEAQRWRNPITRDWHEPLRTEERKRKQRRLLFHLLPRAFASLRSLAHPRDKPENPRGLPIRKSRGYSSPYSNRSVNCSFWSHKGRTGRKAVIFAHTDIAQRNVQRNTYKEKKDPSNAVLKTANNLDILYAI